MAANGRFDLSLSRSDGPTYGTGHRVPYAIAALERSGSFREGSDRIFSSSHNTSKSSTITSQGEMTYLLQSLASDLKGVVPDPKLSRPGEMKRAMSSIFGAPTENSSSSTFETRQFPSSSLEGIKRLKNNLQESSTKARDRAKTFDAACSMIDKFWHLKRKRSRIGCSSNVRTTGSYQGGNIPKTGLQSYASGSGLEIGSQREEKSKIGVPNRRIRTSLLEMDVQTNGTTRTSGPLERDKDMLKPINGSASQLVENDGAFSAVADGWERSKLKKKRSVIKSDASSSSGLSRSQGVEREVKRGMQHKLGIDVRPRTNHAHSFRPGSDSSATMAGNSDASPQQHASSLRSRNELNNGSLQNDKRDERFCPDTESASLRVITKPNSREDRCASSPSFLKFGSSRTRTNPASLPKTSANIHRVVGNPEDMELPQATEKLNALGVNNRKRAASVRSSSPPVGQWAIQKPKKFSRSTRRSSLSPLVSSHDELAVSEAVDEASIHHDSLGEARNSSLNASQQCKMRGDSLVSVSLSESEESGVQENKVKCKVNKCTEMEDKSGQTVQKSPNLIMASRKNRMAVEEDSGDGDRRQGRIGRGLAPTRSGLAATIEKLGEAVTAKQQRSVRHGSERVESKPDRPPIKKFSDRKAYTRPKQSINILSMESSEEAADDQEELVAAATAALDTGRACSSSLWKQLDTVFSFVSSEDVAFLLEQIQLTNESATRTHAADGDNSENLKVDHEHITMSLGPVVTNTWKNTAFSNGISSYKCDREGGFTKETVNTDPILNSGVSICQTLLSAIIGEEDMENICSTVDYGEGYSYEDCYAAQFELDKSLKSKVLNPQLLEDSQAARRTSYFYKVDANWRFCDEISIERSGTNGIMETYDRPISSFQQSPRQLIPKQATQFNPACTEFQYNQMSINDRLILELSEIGLYPEVEPVPDLTYGEDEDIADGIHMLEEKLIEQAANRKSLLLKLEKAVKDAKELQQRRVEWLAMDRLVQIAYDRYMACWGPSVSGTKNVNKLAKHATMAFVKRTLARFQKLEETGISCFNQPIFRDIFSASLRSSNSLRMNIPANDHNTFMASQIARKVDTHAKCSNAVQEHPFSEDDPWSNRVKKEVFLDDVAGNPVPSSRIPGLGNSLVSGAKGKRSERDRDGKGHNRDSVFKNGTAKIGRPPACSGAKGERKNKSKPKNKTTQLSASVNVLHGKNTEMLATGSSLVLKSSGFGACDADKKDNSSPLPDSGTKKFSKDRDATDLSNLQLPDIDVGDFGGQGQDIASWLNFEDEGLQDHGDCMGLEIPMDDLSDVHMMI